MGLISEAWPSLAVPERIIGRNKTVGSVNQADELHCGPVSHIASLIQARLVPAPLIDGETPR
jgi:hypothetical protein